MASPMWKDTAIFLTWDDYGGFYDHVPPVELDPYGLGIRVPLLDVSPYAKQGAIDSSAGRVLERAALHRGQLGAHAAHAPRRDRGEPRLQLRLHPGTSRAGEPLPMRDDCEGPAFDGPDNV